MLVLRTQPMAAQASTASATLSGAVTVDRGTVRAFRVRARDTVNRITYTVFTTRGRYQIYNLPASTYEVSVLEPGFAAPTQQVELPQGQVRTVDVALKAEPVVEAAAKPQLMDFDELYPPGPGRDILVQHCFGCHGPTAGWHRRGGKTEAGWRQSMSRMFEQEAYLKGGKIAGIGAPPAMEHGLTEADKDTVARYLATHFPPNHSPRDWKLDPLVRDEAALSRAVYVQYEYPPVQGPDFADSRVARQTHDPFVSSAQPGVIWVAGIGSGSILAVNTRDLNFATRTKEWRIPHPQNINSRPHGLVEHNGNVFYAGLGDDSAGELNPKTGEFRRYPAPTPGGGAHTLRLDSKGNIWFTTVYGKSRINRVDAVTKKVTEYNPYPGANWYGILTDNQDRVWAVGYGSLFGVIMFDPRANTWTTYPTSATNRRLTIDPSGNVWANQYFGNAISKIDVRTGKVSEYKLPLKYGNPYEGWSDPDGNIWVENEAYNSLVRFEPATGRWTYFPFPEPRSHAPKIEIDAEGTIWDAGFSPRPSQLRALKPRGNAPRAAATH
jgi:virginiamycin B lyase